MTNRFEGFDGVTETTEWTYYTSGNGKGQVKTEKRQSGLLTQYTYDSLDRVISETRSGPGMMTETTTYDYTPVDASDPVLPVDTRPRTIVKTLDGIECERTYYVYSPLTNIIERVGEQGVAYGGTNVLRTITAYYPVVDGDLRSGFVKSIRHEDGKIDAYDYELSSNTWIRTVTHLHEQSPAPVSGKTTRDITLTNARGENIEQKTEAFIDGIWYTIARNRMTYNAEGKRTSLQNLAGQVTTTAWDCWSVTYNGENRPVLWTCGDTKEEALAVVMNEASSVSSVGWGGSESIKEIGVRDRLAASGKEIRDHRLDMDLFLLSANALTVDGRIVNIDGRGNRVAASIAGPKRVVYVIGRNKIVEGGIDAAIARIKAKACPPNCRRLGKQTPCALTGVCADCDSPDRICKVTAIFDRKPTGVSALAIVVNDDLGY